MNFQTSIRTCFQKYVTFSGRAQRSEFWWFVLFTVVVNWVLTIIDSTLFGTVTSMSGADGIGFSASTNTPVLSGIFGLAVFLPSISVAVRRLHDTDRSGWWWWLILVPIVGWIIMIIWYATKGTDGDNRFGADPLGGGGAGDGGDYAPSSVPNVSSD